MLICLILSLLVAKSFYSSRGFGGLVRWGFGVAGFFNTDSIKVRDKAFSSESREPGKLSVN